MPSQGSSDGTFLICQRTVHGSLQCGNVENQVRAPVNLSPRPPIFTGFISCPSGTVRSLSKFNHIDTRYIMTDKLYACLERIPAMHMSRGKRRKAGKWPNAESQPAQVAHGPICPEGSGVWSTRRDGALAPGHSGQHPRSP